MDPGPLASSSVVRTGAILFTDMVDSTALRSRLGEERADVLRLHHDELIAVAVATHGGEVARWTGDGVKAGFASASDAVAAAVSIQRAVIAYGLRGDAVAVFQVRIGISVGEITIDEAGDHHGVAVVEAARLEALARPGDILVTEMVRMLGQRRANVEFEEVGERTLKGLDLPVRVHRVVDSRGSNAPPLPRFLVADGRLPLVGRDEQLEAFQTRWGAARAGHAGLMLVRGQAGIGKTRFVSRCAGIAHEGGALVLAGLCSSDVDVPYEPLAMAFRNAVGLDDALDASLDGRSGPLSRLFPGDPTGSAEVQPALARLDLFEAVAALLQRLSLSYPVMLVVEDLHWATAPTVLLLRHLITERQDQRLLIVGTYRDGDLASSHPLRELLAEARSASRSTLIDPGLFSEADMTRLITALVPTAPFGRAAMVANTVQRETAGNPFFTAELLQHLMSTGQLERALEGDAEPHLSVPDSVTDVVTQRLERLAAGATDVLRIGAVIGLTFDVDLVADVAGSSADHVLDVLEEVARAGLVNEVGVDRFTFVHAIVRTALLDGLSESRRARAHRKVAEALEARGADQFDELARHWQLAGVGANSTKYLVRAAERDTVALAYESARARYQQVIELLNHDPRVEVGARARAWLGYGAACRALGDPMYKDAVARAGRMARAARDHDMIVQAASLSTELGTSFFYVAELPHTEMIELCEDALEMVPGASSMRVQLLASLASHLTFAPTSDQRAALIDEANMLAAELGDPLLTASVLHAEFVCMWEPATLDRREHITRELGRLARATGDDRLAFLSGFFAAYCLLERGDVVAAVERLQRVDATLESTHPSQYDRYLVERLRLSIDVFRSVPDAQGAVDDLFQRYGRSHVDAEPTWTIQTAVIAFQAGALGELLGSLQAMTTGAQSRMWSSGLAVSLLWSGDAIGAQQVIDDMRDVQRNYFWLAAKQAITEVAAELGDLDHCRQLYDELLPYRGRIGVTGGGSSCFGLVARSLGVLALALDDLPVAIELLREAVEQADRNGLVFDGVSARRSLAAALIATDHRDAAAELLGAALLDAQARGFRREVSLIEQLSIS